MNPQTINLPPFFVRAGLSSIREDDRTVDVVFSTGAAVDRLDAFGQRFREVLGMQPGNVRLGRLNAGAPVLDSHANYSVSNILGAVVQGSAVLRQGSGLAKLRFSQRAEVLPIWRDIVDGILRFVSVGYRVHKYEESAGADRVPVRTAVDWEPYEISLVPMPADAGAAVREAADTLNRCLVVPAHGVSVSPADAERVKRLERAKAEQLRSDDADRNRRLEAARRRGYMVATD